MKTKLIVAGGIVALLLLSGVAVTVARNRDREADEALRSANREVNVHYETKARKAEPPAAAPAAPTSAAAVEEVQPFTSFKAWYEAILKASFIVDNAERARAFRRLGYTVTEAEMAAASKDCPYRPGTEEFSKHILRALDKVVKDREPGRFLAMIRGFTDIDDKMRRKLIRRLFEQWVERDPEAARTAAASLPENEGRDDVLARIATPKTSVEDLARIMALPEGAERSYALQAPVAALVRKDPREAVRTLEALPSGQARSDALVMMVKEWALLDFSAAVAWAEKKDRREPFLWQAISAGADVHPKEAADAAVRLIPPKDPMAYLTVYSVAAGLAKSDPAAAAKFLDQYAQMMGRSTAINQEVAPRWGASDPVEALVWAQQLPASEQAEAVRAVMTGWVKSPKGKLSEAREMTSQLPEALRPKAMEAVVLAWAEIEPPAAAAFALKESPSLLTDVVGRWMKRDDAAATAWVRGLNDPEARDQALVGMCLVNSELNFPNALRFAEEIRETTLRDKTLGRLASTASKLSGVDAGLDILRKVGDPKVRDGSLGMMVRRISTEDPRTAAGMVDQMTDAEQRNRAIDSILTLGSQADPLFCRELLTKLPRVECVQYQHVASGFAKKDPVAAATWALTLPEKQMDSMLGDRSQEYEAHPRSAALGEVMNEWGAKDPDSATRWIRSATMSEDLRSQLLGTVKFRRDQRRK